MQPTESTGEDYDEQLMLYVDGDIDSDTTAYKKA